MIGSWSKCPICSSKILHYAFKIDEYRVVKCQICSLMGINPQPNNKKLSEIYNSNYFSIGDTIDGELHSRSLKQKTANHYLALLNKYFINFKIEKKQKKLLEVGFGYGDFLKCAHELGFQASGVELSKDNFIRARNYLTDEIKLINGEIFDLSLNEKYDVIVFNDVLEHVRDPKLFLSRVHELLNEEGVILCVIPSLDSFSAKFQKMNWIEFKIEHLFYFNNSNIKKLLYLTGFRNFFSFPAKKTLSLRYINQHFIVFKRKFWTPVLSTLNKILPSHLTNRHIDIVASGVGIIASKREFGVPNTITVLMAVYNEYKTVEQIIHRVLSKKIDDYLLDLVIVESNSTDGTRKIIEKFINVPRVTVIFEEAPRGKGAAIRKGLESAKGEIILIQDADNEYDIEDYDALIYALRDGSNSFVLGSRHGGSKWKVRHFEGQPIVAFLANLVHWQLTYLINVLYGINLTDPFTMYKVFRRSAINNLIFESNRFDFDYELLLKLVRSGHIPIEIPVNYSARSFKDGKKVRFFKDPLTWIWAILKYRFVGLYKSKNEFL